MSNFDGYLTPMLIIAWGVWIGSIGVVLTAVIGGATYPESLLTGLGAYIGAFTPGALTSAQTLVRELAEEAGSA